MALTKFRLVNTQGLKGVFFNGDTIPFDKIDDTLAEQLIGKTHVLERVPEAPATAPVPELPAAAPVAVLPTAEGTAAEGEVAPATSGRRRASA